MRCKNGVVMITVATMISLVLCSCANNNEEVIPAITEDIPRSEQTVTSDIVYNLGINGMDKIEPLLEELLSINPDTGEKWKKISEYFYEVDSMQCCNSVLPDGLNDGKGLCIVVLGYQLNDNGSMKEELEKRLITAYENAVKYPNAYIACTGGGTARNDPTSTEAGKMAQWLVEKGIEKDRIIIEDTSLSTVENARNTCNIIEKSYPEIKEIAIVTSDYHIKRGCLYFQEKAVFSDLDLNVAASACCKMGKSDISREELANSLLYLANNP